jgi:hypothetical protein
MASKVVRSLAQLGLIMGATTYWAYKYDRMFREVVEDTSKPSVPWFFRDLEERRPPPAPVEFSPEEEERIMQWRAKHNGRVMTYRDFSKDIFDSDVSPFADREGKLGRGF